MLLEEDIVVTQTASRREFELDYLLHPAGAFRTPMEVVSDPDLTAHEKRAILASWASDTWAPDTWAPDTRASDSWSSDGAAAEASPELCQQPVATPIAFDDILEALKQLDGDVSWQPSYGRFINRARCWKDLYRQEWGGRSLFG